MGHFLIALVVSAAVGLAGAIYRSWASGSSNSNRNEYQWDASEYQWEASEYQWDAGDSNSNSNEYKWDCGSSVGDSDKKGPWMKGPGQNGLFIPGADFDRDPKGNFLDLRKGK